jgi:hypothetical protein
MSRVNFLDLIAIVRKALQMGDETRRRIYGTDTLDLVLDAIVEKYEEANYSPAQEE